MKIIPKDPGSSSESSRRRDLDDKERATVDLLRQRISTGEYGPGSQMPTRRELVGTLGVSLITVQRAMEQLEREGFIVSRGAAGTRVAENPPHLSRFGLLFLSHPLAPAGSGGVWSQFSWAIKMAAESLELNSPRRGCRFSIYYDLFPGKPRSIPGYQGLMDDLQAGRLAGLIITMPHILVLDSILTLQAPAVLTTTVPLRGIPCVFPDLNAFLSRAVAHLATRGRRRLAWLGMGSAAPHALLAELSRESGLSTRNTWHRVTTPQEAQEVARRLFSGPAKERPDALIIADDHLVPQASVGLLLAGIHTPEEVEVIAYANFPMPLRAFLPVTYLGFDFCDLIARCVERIQQQRRGETPVLTTTLLPLFEDELPSLPGHEEKSR